MIHGLESPSLNERKVRIFHRCASRIHMEPTNLPQWQFQIAMLVGLLVFPIIWARGMKRYSPIQDLSQAYKALIIGFIVGAILASALDVWVFQTMYTDLAESGYLYSELSEQIDRMIDSPKISEFVNSFSFEWLRLDRHKNMDVDVDNYEDFISFP